MYLHDQQGIPTTAFVIHFLNKVLYLKTLPIWCYCGCFYACAEVDNSHSIIMTLLHDHLFVI